MGEQKEQMTMGGTDYFAKELLAKLPTQDPLHAAYEAQDVSRDVGFDFVEIEDVLERALDEVRETREAYLEEGDEGREHFGDEIADLAFSLVNLIRHKGADGDTLPEVSSLTDEAVEDLDVEAATADIALDMAKIADRDTTEEEALSTYAEGLQKCAVLANSYGFSIGELLRQNVDKYLRRCDAIETLAAADGKQWRDLTSNGEVVTYWKRAKAIL